VIEQAETQIGGTAMNQLLVRSVTNGISLSPRALDRGRAEHETRDTEREMRLFAPGSGSAECGSGLPADGIARRRRDRIVQMLVSGCNSSTVRSLLRGFCDARRQARSSASASPPHRTKNARREPRIAPPVGYGFHLRRTLHKCRASALGVAPTRLASPGVTRADREFKNGDSPCI